ncbi:MAG: DUF2256 domain-containing protein [Alphaproteobacteria bacterium]|uniref:DUF2256 domain-containing protein n=1 Tax=Maricaulis alexandrii TaxID=2570354 RepID=UPI0011093BD2|nr:DUF2256 domain-containing protein [Maricaulis alexandrii]MCR9267380.1 DUF2256 domain-containing protein [Alphaproteobacteria bacterium]
MARHVSRKPKPDKTCLTCGRPFQWRKKWESVWDEVKYCSERCRRSKLVQSPSSTSAARSR